MSAPPVDFEPPSEPSPPRAKRKAGFDLDRLPVIVRWLRRMLFQSIPPQAAREVRQSVEEDGKFSERYGLMCALSAGIATLGLLQSSSAVVIGAMLISPLMGPIAALGFGFASFDAKRIQEAARVVGLGSLIGVAIGIALTLLSPIRNATPEIIARTAPTLLDLVVALLSGLAGGYATVHRKGETAIGVAIATALMPPLATFGYSLAVLRFDFAAGAGLLFLTNLAAISFAFALVARLRGVARPIEKVEFRPRHLALGLVAFFLLAAPLAWTLQKVTQESFATAAVRRELQQTFGVDGSQIAQLLVTWRTLQPPTVAVTVVTPTYRADAEAVLAQRLTEAFGRAPELEYRQVVAADPTALTQAMINAALEQQSRQSTSATPPIQQMRAASRIPTLAAWTDASTRTVMLSAAPVAGLRLRDYATEEERLNAMGFAWRVALVPPFQEHVFVPFEGDQPTLGYAGLDALERARWALMRWNVSRAGVEGMAGRAGLRSEAGRTLASERANAVAERLRSDDLTVIVVAASAQTLEALEAEGGAARVQGVEIRILPAADAAPAPTPPRDQSPSGQ